MEQPHQVNERKRCKLKLKFGLGWLTSYFPMFCFGFECVPRAHTQTLAQDYRGRQHFHTKSNFQGMKKQIISLARAHTHARVHAAPNTPHIQCMPYHFRKIFVSFDQQSIKSWKINFISVSARARARAGNVYVFFERPNWIDISQRMTFMEKTIS